MKSIGRYAFTLTLAILLLNCSKQDDCSCPDPGPVPNPLPDKLIAHYPLLNNAVDLTGINGPIQIQNAPFQNGGIFCNGVYVYSPDPFPCFVETPPLQSFDFGSFSVSVDFKVTEIIQQPVWVLGYGCRWLGFYLNWDGNVALLYNNANWLATNKAYTLNNWHNAKVVFDGVTAGLFLDNVLVTSLKFGSGYAPLEYSVCGNADNQILITHYGNGQTFKGHLKELKVYSR